jgi:HSP20 family molecular chaperone IbpA
MATSLMRRNPFGVLDSTQSRMWDWFTTPMGHTPLSKLFGEVNGYVPPVDIYETREEVIVAASLPGLDAAKTNIEVIENQLVLSGEQNSIVCFEADENATLHMNGIPRYGKFSFAFRLPAEVDANQAQAKYDNGVLCMRFLKAQKARPVRININGISSQNTVDVSEQPQITAQSEQTEK